MKREELPLRIDHHVIVDTRSGATYLSEEHTAARAMMDVLRKNFAIEQDLLSMEKEYKDSLTRFVVGQTIGSILGIAKTDLSDFVSDGVLRVGPMETIDACLHEKQLLVLRRRFAELTRAISYDGKHDVERHDNDILAMLDRVISAESEQEKTPGDSFLSMLKEAFPNAQVLTL